MGLGASVEVQGSGFWVVGLEKRFALKLDKSGQRGVLYVKETEYLESCHRSLSDSKNLPQSGGVGLLHLNSKTRKNVDS